LYKVGDEVSFEYRCERGDVQVKGAISKIQPDPEFSSWLCKVNDIWYDQEVIDSGKVNGQPEYHL
jgi:hypothetical protein